MATRLQKELQLARTQWERYNHGLYRGHTEYQKAAKKNEDFYFGAGRQWDEETKRFLENQGKPWLEENIIFSTINTVIGYQTQSRMDISYKPREIDDQEVSDVLSKLAMFIIDQNNYPWLESEVFSDGLIQQRGYFDIRMDFDDNINGDINISVLDPLDVIPDPDSKSYDPDDWADVTVSSWMSFDDIKETYGLSKWRKLQSLIENEADFGEDSSEERRNKFGTVNSYSAYYTDSAGISHARVISRQYWKLQNRLFYVDLKTGDLTPVPDSLTESKARKQVKGTDVDVIRKLTKRVRWTVSTKEVVLHDEWSPYDHFTIVPYFPYFRRGVTVGLVDNLIKTQEMLNKVYSQILHTVNTTANSGWIVEEGSLVNMDVEDLEDVGSQTGLVIEYKTGRPAPKKIEPNSVPTGLKDLVTSGVDLIRLISGVSETFQGGKGPEVSGTAIQSRVHQAAVQLAAPIDNLFRTRNIIANRILNLIQSFYTDERVFVITGANDEGQPEEQQITINSELESGVINDVTVGKYDVVITDVPTQISFQNAQFSQAVEMRKYGVEIPDDEMILLSTLSRKNEIAKKIAKTGPSQEELQKIQLESDKLKAETEKADNQAKSLEANTIKTLADVAQLLSDNPQASTIVDGLISIINKEENTELSQGQQEQEGEMISPEQLTRLGM
jgi:hypothetical protein